MSKTHDYTKPPRTMPHTFARQGETIKRLQQELDAANDRIVELKTDFQLAIDDATELQGEIGALLYWAQRAFAQLFKLLESEPNCDSEQLLQDAPEAVKGDS